MVQAHTGHKGSGGIQQHSCGPVFPFLISMQGKPDNGRWYIWIGWEGNPEFKSFYFNSTESRRTAYDQAYDLAVRLVKLHNTLPTIIEEIEILQGRWWDYI